MALFRREIKRLRRRENELINELRTMGSQERQLIERLRKVHLSKYELEAEKEDHDGGD
jgi:hypothetical protein